jgi:hypothetical protein
MLLFTGNHLLLSFSKLALSWFFIFVLYCVFVWGFSCIFQTGRVQISEDSSNLGMRQKKPTGSSVCKDCSQAVVGFTVRHSGGSRD